MMKINIDNLTEPELVDLNHRVVERLRFLNQMRAHVEMLEFKIGDRVAFGADRMHVVEGMLTRYNKKTVTVIADDDDAGPCPQVSCARPPTQNRTKKT